MAIHAFNASLLGLQRSHLSVATAADSIARQPSGAAANSAPVEQNDVAKELVNQRVGKLEADASAKVVKTADERLGTLTDLFV